MLPHPCLKCFESVDGLLALATFASTLPVGGGQGGPDEAVDHVSCCRGIGVGRRARCTCAVRLCGGAVVRAGGKPPAAPERDPGLLGAAATALRPAGGIAVVRQRCDASAAKTPGPHRLLDCRSKAQSPTPPSNPGRGLSCCFGCPGLSSHKSALVRRFHPPSTPTSSPLADRPARPR